MVVPQNVNTVDVWGHLGDKFDNRVRLVVELDVLDTTFGCADDSLIVHVIHLSGDDGVTGHDSCDHVRVRGHDLGAFVGVAHNTSLCAGNDDLRVPVDNRTDGLSKDHFLFAVLNPFKLANVGAILRVRVHCDDGAICRSQDDQLAIKGRWKLRSERGASEVGVLQILVHLWVSVEHLLILHVVFPDNEAASLANRDEVNLIFGAVVGGGVGVDNDFVNAFLSEDDGATVADKTRVYVKDHETVLLRHTIRDEEPATIAEYH